MAYDFEAIRRDHPLETVAGRTLALKRSGANKVASCPFHGPDRTPSFVVYQDQTFHCFGCSAHGDVIDFVRLSERVETADAIARLTGGVAPTLTAEDRAKLKREADAADARREAREEAARVDAEARWKRATALNGTPNEYLTRKDVAPYGARCEGPDLLLPIFDAAGRIISVQSIPPAAGEKKLFHAGARMAGGRLMLGRVEIGPIVVAEGFATGATIQAATGLCVAVAFSSGNMAAVAADLAARFPERGVVIAADANGMAAAMTASEAAGGARIVAPDLAGAEGTDFNDQAGHYGLADVARCFDAVEDLVDDAGPDLEVPQVPQPDRALRATAFQWRAEDAIPKREWLYGRHLLRKFLSVDVAAGGVGKSSLKIGEALAMASGRDLYAQGLHEGPLTVWLYNLEDPAEETERRIHATAKRFNIAPDDVAGRLYADSGRDQPVILATETPTGTQISRPVSDALIAEIAERGIDVLIVDPFVSSHAVSENDNGAIDLVAKEWARIADVCRCSINLVHHVRKQNGQEATADSARGASALIGAARSVMVFNRMNKEEGEKAGVAPDETRFFFRVDNDKANLAPATSASWYRMNNVDLDNGDGVGVACPWSAPDVFEGLSVHSLIAVQRAIGEGEWRENAQAKKWVGYAVASALGLNADDKRDRARITRLIKAWLSEGALEIVEMVGPDRHSAKYVGVGKWATG